MSSFTSENSLSRTLLMAFDHSSSEEKHALSTPHRICISVIVNPCVNFCLLKCRKHRSEDQEIWLYLQQDSLLRTQAAGISSH